MNAQSSRMRKVELLSLWYRGGHQGSERLGICSKSHSSCGMGMMPSPATGHYPTLPPHSLRCYFTESPSSVSSWGVVVLSSPTLREGPLGALPWVPSWLTWPPPPLPPNRQSNHSSHRLKAIPIPTPSTPLWFGKFWFSLQDLFVLYTNKTNRNQKIGLVQMMLEAWRWGISCKAIRGVYYYGE